MSNNKNLIEELLSMGTDNGNQGDPNYDEIMKNFKVSCPVKKINLTMEEPNFINGMYLIAEANSVKRLKEKADLSNLNDDTLLFFTNQHIVELANVFNGILYMLEVNNLMNSEKRTEIVIFFISRIKNVITYKNYKTIAETILSVTHAIDLEKLNSLKELIEKVSEIMKLIPFVSYSTLDEIAQTAINSYKESLEKKDANND